MNFFWQITKKILNGNKMKPCQSIFKQNDSVITDGNLISEYFNNFYVNVGPSTAAKIPPSTTSPSIYLKGNYSDSFYAAPVTSQELEKLLLDLNNSACGWDGFEAKVIKNSYKEILEPFLHICNLSLTSGVFPRQLKIAKVVPLFKAGDPMFFSNYRPVSILPILSKILERIMYKRLLEYIEKLHILNNFQFGFRKNHSAAMALICLIDKISKAIEKGEFVLGLFLDFSKAFDTVNFEILLSKLSHYGIRGTQLNWFNSYLSDRSQFVSYNGCNSSKKTVVCGVPQGSILGPLLFLLYVNDLGYVSELIFNVMFADDTNMFMSGLNVDELATDFNCELQKVNKWIQTNKLALNIDKTNFILFRGKRLIQSTPRVFIDDKEIKQINKSKFLGVILDDCLSWIQHIDHIAKKMSKSIGILARLSKYLDSKTLVNMYYAFVYPYLHYCNEVWGHAYASHQNRLYILQKRAIRIISKFNSRLQHTAPLFMKFGILRLVDINKYIVGQFMFRVYHQSLPNIINNLFTVNSSVYEYNTRLRDAFHVPRVRSNMTKMTIGYKGVTLWNSICKQLNITCHLLTFKGRLKYYLLNQY